MARAVASHILVTTEAQALDLKQQITEGAGFADLASQHSTCPSGRSLGEFGQGDMVPEFDAVIFGDLPIGQVSDPLKTKFGFHLIEVKKRIE